MRCPMADDGFLRSLGEKPIWEAFGSTWMRWVLCVCAQCQWSGMCQRSLGRTVCSFSSWFGRSRQVCRTVRPSSHSSGMVFKSQSLKGESESSGGYQAGNVNNEAMHVIGLLAKVALSHGPGHLVPGNVRSGKEMWLVWVLSEPADFLPVKFCCCVYTLCLFGMSVGFQTCLGVVNSRRADGGLPPCAGIEAENSQRVDWFLLSC